MKTPIPQVPETSFSFTGWNLKDFLKGRKKLLITLVGAIAGYLITNNPIYAGITAGLADLAYALIEYYIKE